MTSYVFMRAWPVVSRLDDPYSANEMRVSVKMRPLIACTVLLMLAAQPLRAAKQKPNIVYIVTDDQDIKLGSLDVQPAVKSLLTEKGLFFENAFVTTPVCCPSRSSILTGKYTHNHHTYENSVAKGCNAPSWRVLNENKTIGVYMSMAGYKTGFFGKYLNNYGFPSTGVNVSHVPPGWSRWYALRGNSVYYNYIMSNDGKAEHHGNDYSKDYLTDVLRKQAVAFIQDMAGNQETPFFMYISTPAPHRPATPAPQYEHKFDGKKAPRTPSYGVAGVDKHWLISKGTPPMNTTIADAVDLLYEMRLETLLSVDDLVSAVLQALEEEGVFNNTFIFYNSDHGYHLGQFNQQGEKRQPYEENIRVPLIVRGPGVHMNTTTSALALSIDLAPTFLDLAGWPLPEDMDGMSLKPVILGEETDCDAGGYQFLIEYFGEGRSTSGGCFAGGNPVSFLHDCWNNTFLALRSSNAESGDFIFTEFFSNDTVPMNISQVYFKEYYNITEDDWELKNEVSSLTDKQVQAFQETLLSLHTCSGSSCHKLRQMTECSSGV